MRSRDRPGSNAVATKPGRRQGSFRLPNDIEFSGERKRVRCNEGLDNRKSQQKRESWRHERGENKGLPAPKVLNEELPKFRNSEETDGTGARPTG